MSRLQSRKRLRIAFALPNLARDGGAERVLLSIVNHLDLSRYEPILVVLHVEPDGLSDRVPKDIAVVSLNVKRVRYAPIPLAKALRRLKPDVLFSGLGHLNLMIAIIKPLFPRSLAIIGRETSVVTEINNELNLSRVRNALYRRFYPSLDHVICQSQDMFVDLTQKLGFPSDRASIIFNPIDAQRIQHSIDSSEPPPEPIWPTEGTAQSMPASKNALNLVAIGRLQPQKGFDILLNAISLLTPGSVRLVLIGQGELMSELKEQAENLGISKWISFQGYQSNPYPYIKAADALVLSSRYEGLPNVVLESLACETPVIATPCPGGLAQIAKVAGGVTLAERVDAKALAAAIGTFNQSESNRQPIDISPFEIERIVVEYQDLIDRVVRLKSHI